MHRQPAYLRQTETSFSAQFMALRPILSALALFLTGFLASGIADEPSVRFVAEWGRHGKNDGEFDFPIGIAVAPSDEVLVTDFYNDRVQRFDADGKHLATFPVPPHPGAIALDEAGHCYITHFGIAKVGEVRKPDRLTVHDAQGNLLCLAGEEQGTGPGQFQVPHSIARDSRGFLYIADSYNHRVQKLAPSQP